MYWSRHRRVAAFVARRRARVVVGCSRRAAPASTERVRRRWRSAPRNRPRRRRPVLPRRRQPRLRRQGLPRRPRLHPGRPEHRRAPRRSPRCATKRLKRFHLDLIGFDGPRVGRRSPRATFERTRRARARHHAAKRPIAKGTVVQARRSATTASRGATPSARCRAGGTTRRRRGAGFIAGEPHSCTLWYPCNDHPTDKATFELKATVPRPFAVVSVGKELPVVARRGRGAATRSARTTGSSARRPPTYLTTIYIDKLEFERSQLAGRHPGRVGVRARARARPCTTARPGCPRSSTCSRDAWGPYPAPPGGRHLRARRRAVLAGDLHAPDLHRGRRHRHDRARERPPVVGRQRVDQALARHLSERVLRVVQHVLVARGRGTRPGPRPVVPRGLSTAAGRVRCPTRCTTWGRQRVRLRGRLLQRRR